ncbi:MAG: ABC transporter permease [Lachnospiraceae bacterium]|nr:ABC transporter permease [Lachnospiraceae bacterium]
MKTAPDSHELFMRQYRRQKYKITGCRMLLLFSLLFLWEAGTRSGLLNGFIFSSPSRIIKTACSMIRDGSLFQHIGITLFETLGSFLLITILSILTAMLLWWIPTLAKILEPFFVLLNSLPKSALAPILIVWMGNNMKTIIITAISIAVFGSIINLHTGFIETNEDQLKLIQILGGNKFHCMRYIIIPGSIPLIISTMKVNIGLSLVGVIIGEFLAAKAGLGYLIIYGSQVFKLDWVMLSIIILCAIAMLLYKMLSFLEKYSLKNM